MSNLHDLLLDIRALEIAILNKGGKIVKANHNPTLKELKEGILSIETAHTTNIFTTDCDGNTTRETSVVENGGVEPISGDASTYIVKNTDTPLGEELSLILNGTYGGMTIPDVNMILEGKWILEEDNSNE